ncbi:SGNH hydrolase-type esterase domain-containing protein [Tanacetum coccineum]|uniref:SGNH hydrolase-type esterase domain-containing protein n=1 Tax=Tanacetum coccineum TaxID=301880 RepID=A0ABQ5I7Y9_9ASTR
MWGVGFRIVTGLDGHGESTSQNQRDLPRDIPLDSVEVLRYEKRSKNENKGRVLTEMKLVLEQTQEGTSYEVSVSAKGVKELKRKVKIKGEKKEALLTLRQKPERFDTSAGNPIKEILLKLNLPDHRILKDGGKVAKMKDDSDDEDLDVYEPRVGYDENDGIYAKVVIFVNKRLVRLMDVTVEQCLDLIYGDHKKVDVKVKEELISKWLVQSYKKQFDEYMEIKKQWVTRRIDADMEYDPSDVKFAEWLALKFYNHKTMDWYTKNALWIYWTRGDDVVEITNEEFSDPDDENLIDKDEVARIFRIKTDIFDFETPICKAFDELNYLFKIDAGLHTSDILLFKTYNEFKNEWMDEWNKGIPGSRGTVDDLVDGKLKEEALKQKTIYERSQGDATHGVINFSAWLKGCFGNFHELDYELLVKLKEYWWKMNDHECSPFFNWRNHINKAYTNINANYNPYLYVSRTFNNRKGRNDEEDIHEEREPNDDNGISNLGNDLVRDNASYHANDEE